MDDRQFNSIAKALADPQRFALLQRIAAEREAACACLVDEFTISQATISHHIKELAAAGLIACRKAGKCGYFTANRAVMRQYQSELTKRLSPGRGGVPQAPRRRSRARTKAL
jgi:ArsR family transcriptional regulator